MGVVDDGLSRLPEWWIEEVGDQLGRGRWIYV